MTDLHTGIEHVINIVKHSQLDAVVQTEAIVALQKEAAALDDFF